jgi:cytochrome c553
MAHRQEELEDRLATLWNEVVRAHFLTTQPTKEAPVLLEQRRRLVRNLLKQYATQKETQNIAVLFMMDHFHTLLEAELDWLERALASLETGSGNHKDPGERRGGYTVASETQ